MRFKAMLALLAVAALTLIGAPSAQAVPTNPSATAVSYIAVPHPDDEWQAWSLIENSPANYKVFILMTQGEQSGYCDTPYAGSHPAPSPTPAGKWSPSCGEARLNSWVSFFQKMSLTDSTIPGDFAAPVTTADFPANGTTVNRIDPDETVVDRAAKVWIDQQGRGALVSFNMGDGDLTPAEVAWAVNTVKDNRATLGLDTTLPNYNLLGTFAHSGAYGAACATYAHNDHYSIHSALYNTNFGMVGYNSAATCSADPDKARTLLVSTASTAAAWNGTMPAFKYAYGWLGPYTVTYYQDKIFMRTQSFWQKF